MRLLRRAKQPRKLTDFRQVSETVHEHRTERARNSMILRENPEEAEAAVRTYIPEQRLREVSRETQRLFRDSRGIPRMWDPETPRPQTWSPRRNFLTMLGFNLFFVVGALAGFAQMDRKEFSIDSAGIPIGLALLGIAVLVAASMVYLRRMRMLSWSALGVSLIEIAVLIVLISQIS